MNSKKFSKFLAVLLSASTLAGATISGEKVYAEESNRFTCGAVVGVMAVAGGAALGLGLCKLEADKFTKKLEVEMRSLDEQLELAREKSKEMTARLNDPLFILDEESKAEALEELNRMEGFICEIQEIASKGENKFFSFALKIKVKNNLRHLDKSIDALGSVVGNFKCYLDRMDANAEGCRALNIAFTEAFNRLSTDVQVLMNRDRK